MSSAETALTWEVVITHGSGSGEVLALSEPLNLWGGLDPNTGLIVDERHPEHGASIAGRVLVMPPSRGSGTNAQIFASACAQGHGPAAVVLSGPDIVLAAGAIVAANVYEVRCPVVVASSGDYEHLRRLAAASVDTLADAPGERGDVMASSVGVVRGVARDSTEFLWQSSDPYLVFLQNVGDLLERRTDLRGVIGFADVLIEHVRWSA